MTNEEKQEIIEAVLEALQTNSKSISQLTAATEMLDGDLIEIAGGKRISFANLIRNVMAGGVVNDLTTGGGDKALSAEQGKVLKQMIDDVELPMTDTENADLDFQDEDGNVIMRLAGGHIRTKYFNSAESGGGGGRAEQEKIGRAHV